uniref:Uncharacterized protein n=1 Tax=Salix viminalis TaxID=40686 RepID=A0A6N2KD96_SALVM
MAKDLRRRGNKLCNVTSSTGPSQVTTTIILFSQNVLQFNREALAWFKRPRLNTLTPFSSASSTASSIKAFMDTFCHCKLYCKKVNIMVHMVTGHINQRYHFDF